MKISAIPVVFLNDIIHTLVNKEGDCDGGLPFEVGAFSDFSYGDAEYTLVRPHEIIQELEIRGDLILPEEIGVKVIRYLHTLPSGILVAVCG